MHIRVCDLETIKTVLSTEYIDSHVVSIRDTDGNLIKHYSAIDRNVINCASLFHLYFDDVWAPEHLKYGYKLVREGQLAALFKWAEDKEDFTVHCTGGVSRSASIAYLLACLRMRPEDAILYLDNKIHYPNPFVVKLGAKLLNNPDIERVWDKEFEMLDIRRDPCKGLRELRPAFIRR